MFVLGFLLGARLKRGREPLPFGRHAFALALLFVLVAIPANLVLHFTSLGGALVAEHHALTAAMVSKPFCGALRVLNALALVYVLWNLDAVRRLARAPVAEPLLVIGRHSLPVFAAGLVLSTAAQGLMASGLPASLPLQLALLIFGCLVQRRVGAWRERRRRLASRRPAPGLFAAAR